MAGVAANAESKKPAVTDNDLVVGERVLGEIVLGKIVVADI
tara:strand:- start:974 stop:1096 length:123 start_codon:yes stop_codon:yes gene_type:complete